MTKVLLVKAKDGSVLKCDALGHAGFAENGKDIVCSAVTILMRTAMQVLSETSGINFKTDVSLRGHLSFEAGIKESDSRLQEKLLTIGDFLQAGFGSLEKEFPKNITLDLKLED